MSHRATLAAEAIQVLRALKAVYRQIHEFWTDDVSLSDESHFDPWPRDANNAS
jgi:hypothetical protein